MHRIPIISIKYDWSFVFLSIHPDLTECFALDATHLNYVLSCEMVLVYDGTELLDVASDRCNYKLLQIQRRIFPSILDYSSLVQNFGFIWPCIDLLGSSLLEQLRKIGDVLEQGNEL